MPFVVKRMHYYLPFFCSRHQNNNPPLLNLFFFLKKIINLVRVLMHPCSFLARLHVVLLKSFFCGKMIHCIYDVCNDDVVLPFGFVFVVVILYLVLEMLEWWWWLLEEWKNLLNRICLISLLDWKKCASSHVCSHCCHVYGDGGVYLCCYENNQMNCHHHDCDSHDDVSYNHHHDDGDDDDPGYHFYFYFYSDYYNL
uniref:Uncharacterized protein n=1 Tax=Ditylum brightwellii TaxID=49249 RepID=A0A7S4QZC7_9STRA